MKKKIGSVFLLPLLFTACLNMTYVTETAPAALPQMRDVHTLGVARFAVTPEMNRLILMETGGMEGAVPLGMGYPGVDKKVMVVVTAPEAATRYGVTPEKLSALAQDAWTSRLSGKVPFSYQGADERWMPETVSSTDAAGKPVAGFPAVVAIPEMVDATGLGGRLITDLAAAYGVDAILAGRLRVYAEVIKALDEPAEGGMDSVSLMSGQYAVKVEISYEWRLYDGRDGKRLSDGEAAPLKFFNPKQPRKTIFPLYSGISGRNDLERFISSSTYEHLFAQTAVNEMLPYLYLFVPHVRGFYEEAKEESK
jgi:hypothetical protein